MPKVLIVGGGIGGLTAALSLLELGFDVQVYEAATELLPLGVGINLLPHAARELYELGFQEQLEQSGVKTAELVYHNKHGQHIWREPRGLEAGYRWPQISIHRGELQMLLLAAAKERLGSERLHLGQRFASVDVRKDGVLAHFEDRRDVSAGAAGRQHAVSADVLIGADGIHSQLRAQLYPHEGPPRWNHSVMWRGVSEGESFLTGRSMIMAGHSEHKFVCYPIRHLPNGRALINWVAELRLPAQKLATREDWNRRGNLDEFLPQFESWRFPWLDVPGLIRGAQTVYVYPMVDRDPLEVWGHDRITLLGDAAHPMYPVGSNGASQAILDARTLAGCLRVYAERGDLSTALRRYERLRQPATAGITLANRQQGPEHCMVLAEQRAPEGFRDVNDVISRDELAAISAKYKRLAGFSIDELNARPSLAHMQD